MLTGKIAQSLFPNSVPQIIFWGSPGTLYGAVNDTLKKYKKHPSYGDVEAKIKKLWLLEGAGSGGDENQKCSGH